MSRPYWDYSSVRNAWVNGSPKGRNLRILPRRGGYFVHVTSRTRGQVFLFGDEEKNEFVKKMRAWAGFSELTVLTHCIMTNHFHLLLYVPEVKSMGHDRILKKLSHVWPEGKVAAWEDAFQQASEKNKFRMDQEMIGRMGNLPEFMRVLKRSFSCWFNAKHDTQGTLWDSRYRSVVIESGSPGLLAVAAYIDLNPVRAQITENPGAYRWNGITAANLGNPAAIQGLLALLAFHNNDPDAMESLGFVSERDDKTDLFKQWKQQRRDYEYWLYYQEFLRTRIRSFSRGVGLGSAEFLSKLKKAFPQCFQSAGNWKKSAYPPDWEEFSSMRNV